MRKSELTTTFPNHVAIRGQIAKALAAGNIRRIVVDVDGDIVAEVEVKDAFGDLTTGIRQEIAIQPIVLAEKAIRDSQTIAQIRATVDAMRKAMNTMVRLSEFTVEDGGSQFIGTHEVSSLTGIAREVAEEAVRNGEARREVEPGLVLVAIVEAQS